MGGEEFSLSLAFHFASRAHYQWESAHAGCATDRSPWPLSLSLYAVALFFSRHPFHRLGMRVFSFMRTVLVICPAVLHLPHRAAGSSNVRWRPLPTPPAWSVPTRTIPEAPAVIGNGRWNEEVEGHRVGPTTSRGRRTHVNTLSAFMYTAPFLWTHVFSCNNAWNVNNSRMCNKRKALRAGWQIAIPSAPRSRCFKAFHALDKCWPEQLINASQQEWENHTTPLSLYNWHCIAKWGGINVTKTKDIHGETLFIYQL